MIRSNLALRLGLIAGVFGLATVCALLLSFYAALVRQLDTQAREHTRNKLEQVLHAVAEEASTESVRTDPHRIRDTVIGHGELHLVLVDSGTGEVIAEVGRPTKGTRSNEYRRVLGQYADTFADGVRLLSLAGKGRTKNGDTMVAILTAERASDQRFLAHILSLVTLALPFALLFVGGGAWWLARIGLQPLLRFKDASASVSTRALSYRIREDDLPVELRDLAGAFNTMLARLEGEVARLIEFSGDLAHEMRTPISNLLGKTQVTLSRSRTAKHYRSVLESNVEDLERLRRLVEDMLFLAQVERTEMALQYEDVDLMALMRTTIQYFEASFEEKSIVVHLTGKATISADRNMIQRVLLNVLSNAIRHTPQGGEIRVDARDEAQRIALTIANTGDAIPPQHLPHIFQRFYRVDSGRSRTQGGTGLGLAIVRSIVLLHGGQVTVTSEPGEMTAFRIEFPFPLQTH